MTIKTNRGGSSSAAIYSVIQSELANDYTAAPSYKSIKNILTAGQDKSLSEEQPDSTQNKYGITRGAGYYGR